MIYRNESDLGAVVLECRQLPLHIQMTGFGNRHQGFPQVRARLLFYGFLPLFVLPVGSFMLAGFFWLGSDMVMTLAMRQKSPTMVMVALWPIFYAGLYWFTYIWPRSKFLAVREHGITGRWPWPWKRFVVRFDDIAHLHIGRKPDALAYADFQNSIALVLRDGTRISLGYLFANFEPPDAVKFIEILSRKVQVRHGNEKAP